MATGGLGLLFFFVVVVVMLCSRVSCVRIGVSAGVYPPRRCRMDQDVNSYIFKFDT